MQLSIARLCLDCDEVHSEQHCPICASEAFAYLERWVPAPERRMRPRETTSETAEVYRQLTSPAAAESRSRLLRRGALGLTAVALTGWAWQWNKDKKKEQRDAAAQTPEPVAGGGPPSGDGQVRSD